MSGTLIKHGIQAPQSSQLRSNRRRCVGDENIIPATNVDCRRAEDDCHGRHYSNRHRLAMNDAIFFEECEAIFAQRERGGHRLLNTLLTEMERYQGIIMLATNRPLDFDEAMHRRITSVSEFHTPGRTQRYKIWKLASEHLPVVENIDWEKISLRYELIRGFIKMLC